MSGPASGRSVRTGNVRRQGGDIREGNSRTGTTARDAESYQRSTGADLIRDAAASLEKQLGNALPRVMGARNLCFGLFATIAA